jgi:branched-chain amino acid transport system permease protein
MFPIVVERGSSKHRTHMLVLGIIVLALLVLAAFILPEYQVGRVNRMWAMVIAIMGLNLVLGYGGLFALGHSAFIGLGAFMSGWLVQDMGWDHWMAIPFSMASAFAFGSLLALPALRIKGLYLVVITIAVAVVFPSLAKIENFGIAKATGGANGKNIEEKVVPTGIGKSLGFTVEEAARYRYFLIVPIVLIVTFAVRNLLNSRAGRSIIAIRDNETGAAVSGVNLVRQKVYTFGTSAAMCGLAGSILAIDKGFVAEQDFLFPLAVEMLVGLVIGGVATLGGAFIGAFVIVFVKEFSKNVNIDFGVFVLDGKGPFSALIFGVILILTTFFLPRGIVGSLKPIFMQRVYRINPKAPPLPADLSRLS